MEVNPSLLADLLRKKQHEMTAIDEDSRIVSLRDYRPYNAATRLLTSPLYPVSAMAMALRETGVMDEPSVMTGVSTRPRLEEIPGTQEWAQSLLKGDPDETTSNLLADLISPDPTDLARLAHLIPIGVAIRNIETVDPDFANLLGLQRDEAERLLSAKATPEEIADKTGLQAVPVADRTELFYRPPRDNVSLPDLDYLRQLAETPNGGFRLSELYDNPELFKASPETANTPVVITKEPLSAPTTAVMSPMGGWRGGSYNPETAAIDMPVYPPFDPQELDANFLDIVANNPAVLFTDRDELIKNMEDMERQMQTKVRHGLVHETEHSNQHRFKLPRGSNPYEASAIAQGDPNPVTLDSGDQFILPDQIMQRFQRALAFADYGSEGINDAARAFSVFDNQLDDELNKIWREAAEALQGETDQDVIDSVMLQVDRIRRTIYHTRSDLAQEIDNLRDSLQKRGLPSDEEQKVFNRAFPVIKRKVLERNIDRVTDPMTLYQRFWGESAAEAAAYHVADEADIPVVAEALTGLGKVYDPKLLKVREYLDPSAYSDPDVQDKFIKMTLDAEQIDYEELIKSLLEK